MAPVAPLTDSPSTRTFSTCSQNAIEANLRKMRRGDKDWCFVKEFEDRCKNDIQQISIQQNKSIFVEILPLQLESKRKVRLQISKEVEVTMKIEEEMKKTIKKRSL